MSSGVHEPSAHTATDMIGAFFFPDALTAVDAGQRRSMLARLRDHGVTTILTESDVYDDAVIADVHDAGLAFFAGVACFLDTSGAASPPVLATGGAKPQMEWYRGVVPTDTAHAIARLETIERVITDHDVDGLLLDFIRWPMHWELELRPGWPPPVDCSFDAATLADLRERTGLDVPDTDPVAAARWLHTHAPEAWQGYKAEVITRFVAEVRQRTARAGLGTLAVTLVPVMPTWVGQDAAALSAHVDLVMPMLYHAILQRPAGWVRSEVNALHVATDAAIAPILQVDSDGSAQDADWGAPVSDDEFASCLHDTLAAGAAGAAMFTGSALLDEGRLAVLNRVLRG